MKELKEYLNESIIGGIFFAIAAICAAGASSAFISDTSFNLSVRRNKKKIIEDFKNNFSGNTYNKYMQDLISNPILNEWDDWKTFTNMIENGEKFNIITDKAKELVKDKRFEIFPPEIQDGIRNISKNR